MVDTHILVLSIRLWQKVRKNDEFEKRALSLKNSSPDLKADFPQQVNKSMKSTFHKCVVNVIPVTNPLNVIPVNVILDHCRSTV